MAEEMRSPRADVIDIPISVDVDQIRTFSTIDERWSPSDRPERPSRAVDAAGNDLLSTRKFCFTGGARFCIH